jgi:hypothetical protein
LAGGKLGSGYHSSFVYSTYGDRLLANSDGNGYDKESGKPLTPTPTYLRPDDYDVAHRLCKQEIRRTGHFKDQLPTKTIAAFSGFGSVY